MKTPKRVFQNSNFKIVLGIIFPFFLLLLIPSATIAQQVQSDTTDHKSSTIILPAISSSPETSLLFGGVVIRQFKLGGSPENTRTSSVMLPAVYTLKKQISVGVFSSLFLPDEKWVLEGNYAFNYFPESFWGIGPQTREEDEIMVIYREFFLQQSALKKIYSNVFIGPQVRWLNTYDINFEDTDGESIATPDINGANDYSSFGAGAVLRLDSRNISSTPSSGKLIQFSFLAHPSWLGADNSYTRYLFDARQYLDLYQKGKTVLAFQGLVQLTSGKPPFKDMAILGGESIMRGYYSGRYRDRHGAQFQTELRQHLVGRFGFTLFAATGQVWHSFDKMGLDHALWSAGGGLRFNLSKQDPLNLRMDMAFGQNTSGFYFTLGEAF